MQENAQTKSERERSELLDAAVANHVRNGKRVESRSGAQAIMVKGRRVNHILHLLIAVITLGLWLPIWVLLVLIGGEKREVIEVDAYGRVTVQGERPFQAWRG